MDLNVTTEKRVKELEEENKKLESIVDGLSKNKLGFVKRCRICFNEAEGTTGQCLGERSTCSGWSSSSSPQWTQKFRDNTYYEPGGCVYQWRVQCQ